MDATATFIPGTRRRFSRQGFIVLVCTIIVANGIVALIVLSQLRQTDLRVDRALRATLILQDVEDRAVRCGRDQLSYRLSGDTTYLAAYRDGEAQIDRELVETRKLLSDSTEESHRLENLVHLIDQDRAELAATLAPMEPNFASGRLPPELRASADRTNMIVAATDDMQADESALLHKHLTAIAARNTVMLGTVVLGALGSIALIMVILSMMRRDERQMQELADASIAALRESELRFRRIFEQSPLGILLADQGD